MVKKEPSKPRVVKLDRPWTNNPNSIWLASSLQLHRNLAKHAFPAALQAEGRQQIFKAISQAFSLSKLFERHTILTGEETSPIDTEYLHEHFLLRGTFHQLHKHEGMILDETGNFLGIININDHLQLHLLDAQGELENSWNRLVKIETTLGQGLSYAFSPRFGFLTANPFSCGTGLTGSIFLHIPALIHTAALTSALEELHDPSLNAAGLQGDWKNLTGDLLVVSNNYTLGVTEESILSTLRSFANKFMALEKKVRAELRVQSNSEIKDKIARAYGLLQYSFQLRTAETLEALSLCKLGLDLGWIVGIEMTTLNRLYFSSRRAHFMSEINEELYQDAEIYAKRAKYLHEIFKPVTLQEPAP